MRFFVIVQTIKLGGANKDKLIDAVRDKLGYECSVSTIEKDMHFLKYDSDFAAFAPIKWRGSERGYELPKDWTLTAAINKSWRV